MLMLMEMWIPFFTRKMAICHLRVVRGEVEFTPSLHLFLLYIL